MQDRPFLEKHLWLVTAIPLDIDEGNPPFSRGVSSESATGDYLSRSELEIPIRS